MSIGLYLVWGIGELAYKFVARYPNDLNHSLKLVIESDAPPWILLVIALLIFVSRVELPKNPIAAEQFVFPAVASLSGANFLITAFSITGLMFGRIITLQGALVGLVPSSQIYIVLSVLQCILLAVVWIFRAEITRWICKVEGHFSVFTARVGLFFFGLISMGYTLFQSVLWRFDGTDVSEEWTRRILWHSDIAVLLGPRARFVLALWTQAN